MTYLGPVARDPEAPPDPFGALHDAYRSLAVANEALAAVNQTGSKEWSRIGMRVVLNRAEEFVAALKELMASLGAE